MDEMMCMLVYEVDERHYKSVINSTQGKQFGFDNCTTIRTPCNTILFCYLDDETTIDVSEHTIEWDINDTNITITVKHMIFAKSFVYGESYKRSM